MANKNFKARIGIEAPLIAADDGTTAITISNSTGNIALTGTLDVQGGTITESTGALSITTGAANGDITLDPNGTGNVVLTFANGGNITNSRNYTLNAIRNATTAANGNIWAYQTTTSPTRGINLSNSGNETSYRPGIVLQGYSGGASGGRSWLVFENSRGTAASPTAVQNNDRIVEMIGQGYNGTQWTGDVVANQPFTIRGAATEAWTNSPSRAGMKFEVLAQPLGVNYTASSVATIIDHSPTTATYRADSFSINQRTTASGGTGQAMFNIANDGSNHIAASVIQGRATSGSEFALTNFTTTRSTDGVNYTPTQNGDIIGQFKFNGNANTSTSPGVPAGPGAQINASATELWSSTANGTKIDFYAIKTGTIVSYNVISATPNEIKLNATTLDLNSFDGTTPLTSAAINYTRTYGEFCYTNAAGFDIPAQNTIYTMPLDTTLNAQGTSISGTGNININVSGWYKIIMSLQATSSHNGVASFVFWLRKNGSDVANSKTEVDFLKDQKSVVAMDWLVNSDGNDYWEIVYATASVAYADIAFPTIAATTTPYVSPLAPAVIFNVIPIGA